MLVDFWAPWCGPCKQLTPVLEKAVKAAKGKVKLVKMNIDEHPAIPGQMGIQSIPAVIAFVNGQPVDGFMGALPESQIVAFLERLTKDRIGGEAKELLKAAEAALAEGDAAGRPMSMQSPCGGQHQRSALAGWRAAKSRPDARSGAANARHGAGGKAQRGGGRGGARRARTCRAGQDARAHRRTRAESRRQPARPSGALRSRGGAQRQRPADGGARPADRIVKRDRKWNDDGARKQLVQFFEAWGPTDEATVDGRSRLSSILFA